MHDATKTTLSDLLESENKPTLRDRLGVAVGSIPLEHPLVANSTDEIIPFEETPTLTPPRVGDYWQGQGGYYAGIMRDGDCQWHLISASHRTAFYSGASWGAMGLVCNDASSARDGMRNTYAILKAEPSNRIASHFCALLIEGHKDFYWPSRCENNLIFINLPDRRVHRCHWSSTQSSAYTAWYQHFGEGHQTIQEKHHDFCARAVRRILID